MSSVSIGVINRLMQELSPGAGGGGSTNGCGGGLPVDAGIQLDIENCCNMTLCDTVRGSPSDLSFLLSGSGSLQSISLHFAGSDPGIVSYRTGGLRLRDFTRPEGVWERVGHGFGTFKKFASRDLNS
jgi:hypothetical protein